jgi:hypothetical protein
METQPFGVVKMAETQTSKPCWSERNSDKLIRRLQWHERADEARELANELIAEGFARDVALARALDYWGPSAYRERVSRGRGL